MKNYCKIFLFLALIFIFFSAEQAFAAHLFFNVSSQEFTQGEEFLVNVYFNAENEPINAVGGKIVFPSELLELKEIRDGNSAVNFWIERPKLEQSGNISFSGIIPGGSQEEKGFLFSIVFKAKSSGNGLIVISGAKVLLNDGNGTEARLTASPFSFFISEKNQASQTAVQPLSDADPPEEFSPEITSSEDIFGGDWFLVFAAQDKGSGIDHYELLESIKNRTGSEIWETVKSPYLLKDQKLRKYIYVKAVDRLGNERIEMVAPRYPINWYESWWIWSIIALVVLFAVFICYFFRRLLWKNLINK